MHEPAGSLVDTVVKPRRRLLAGVAPAATGALLAVAMTWPLGLRAGSDIAGDVGDPLFQTWQVAWIGHAFLHQPLHVFQSNIAWPLHDSLAFSDALIGYAPAGLLAQRGPHSALLTYNLLVLFAYTLAFLGAYLLARELGAGRAGGVAAGAAFAYAPWRLGETGHLNVISSGGIPLALFLLIRGYRRKDARLMLAGWLVAGWQVTLGFALGLQFVYLLAPFAAIGVGIWLRRHRPTVGKRVAICTAVGLAVFAALTVNQTLPYLRVLHHHPEARRTLAQVSSYSPPFSGFLAAPRQSLVWGGATASVRDSFDLGAEQTLFPGVTIVVLAIAGFFSSAYSRRLRLWLLVGIELCALLSLGIHRDTPGLGKYIAPYRFLYDFAPGWDGIRTPGRINTLTSLGLALLAGCGLSLAVRHAERLAGARRNPRQIAAAGVAAIFVGAILLEGLGPPDHPRVPLLPPGQREASAPQLHLPFGWDSSVLYSYWSTAGFPDTVNEYGSFQPTSVRRLGKTIRRFPDAASVNTLRRLGVRTVILHTALSLGTPWQFAWKRSVVGLSLTRETAPGIVLYKLNPLPTSR
jgi:hypothetical protein